MAFALEREQQVNPHPFAGFFPAECIGDLVAAAADGAAPLAGQPGTGSFSGWDITETEPSGLCAAQSCAVLQPCGGAQPVQLFFGEVRREQRLGQALRITEHRAEVGGIVHRRTRSLTSPYS